MRRHEIPPFITMGNIVGSQIVRVHMTFHEMGFVYHNRYFDRHILIDEVTQLEQFNPNDLEDVGSWSPWDYLCQITRDLFLWP